MDAVFRQHAAAVYRVARRLLNDPADAEDVRQHVFAALLADPGATRRRGGPRRVALPVRRQRRQKSRPRRVPPPRAAHLDRHDHRDPPPDPALPAERADEAARLRRALAELSEQQRAILALRFDGGLSLAAVAAHLNVPPTTARDRCRAAVDRLRALLSDPGSRDE